MGAFSAQPRSGGVVAVLALIGGTAAAAASLPAPGAAAALQPTSAPRAATVAPATATATATTVRSSTVRANAARTASRSARSLSPYRFGTVAHSKWYARTYMARKLGWGTAQYQCLDSLWHKESEWKTNAFDPSQGRATAGGVRLTWGIPQANPGTKMASAGRDWRTNPETQIRWGLSYIRSTYGTPCGAWAHWRANQWY